MENIKQKIVLPTRGVCNTTPDPICEDNELEDCVGFSYSDEAIRPIQDNVPLFGGAQMVGKLLCVHKQDFSSHKEGETTIVDSGFKNYILLQNEGTESHPVIDVALFLADDSSIRAYANHDLARDITVNVAYTRQNNRYNGTYTIPAGTRERQGVLIKNAERYTIPVHAGKYVSGGAAYLRVTTGIPVDVDLTITATIRYGFFFPAEGGTDTITVTLPKGQTSIRVRNVDHFAPDPWGYQQQAFITDVISVDSITPSSSGGFDFDLVFTSETARVIENIYPTMFAITSYSPTIDGDVVYNASAYFGGMEFDMNLLPEYSEESGEYLSYISSDMQENFISEIDGTIRSTSCLGNTLIVNTSKGIFYYLWSVNRYKPLGNNIPEPKVSFALKSRHPTESMVEEGTVEWVTAIDRIWKDQPFAKYLFFESSVNIDSLPKPEWNDLVLGCYANLKQIVAESKRFMLPFAVRYAIELFDGTLYYHSNPIWFFPNIGHSVAGILGERAITADAGNNARGLNMFAICSALLVKNEVDYSDWSDIVRGVVIYVTKGVDTVDTTSDCIYEMGGSTDASAYRNPENCIRYIASSETEIRPELLTNPPSKLHQMFISSGNHLMRYKGVSDIIKEMEEDSVFYRLADIGVHPHEHWTYIDGYIRSSTLKFITTQQTMDDDYYSRCKMLPGFTHVYNSRYHIGNIKRSIMPVMDQFARIDKGEDIYHYIVIVLSSTNSGRRYTIKSFTSREDVGRYFFYNSPKGKEVIIIRSLNNISYQRDNDGFIFTSSGTMYLFRHDLKEHPALNGSYFIESPIEEAEYAEVGTEYTLDISSQYTNDDEFLMNQILVSEASNPFVFKASGNVSIGEGSVMALSSVTKALSQGQFGAFPLMAFTDEGIWALSLNSEGVYTNVVPFSRDVCNNVNSIIQTDGEIFFTTEKGFMCISGAEVTCVSKQLVGKSSDSFINFCKGCYCAYDYRDSQIWIINSEYSYHWIYNMKNGTFSRMDNGEKYLCVKPDYPDSIFQTDTFILKSVLEEPNINADNRLYSGFFITRPMKFEQAMALKSLRDLKHIKDVSPEAEIDLTIYASNDCASWQQLPSLKGRGFKYFKFRYDLTNLKAADAFCGTVLYYTTRLTDRIR